MERWVPHIGRMARRGLLLLFPAVVLLPGCVAATRPPAPSADPQSDVPASQFQRHLDRLGIPHRVPASGRAILVNVPAFELIAFMDGEPALRSPVIVGAPWHPTPLIETYTTAIRFRPTWRPTPAMVRSGEYVDKVWPPGRRNPLGLAAIRLEPGLLVYLHDTNRRDLFARENRALSHGCIRVKRWDELIAWLLGIGLDEVHRLANGRSTFDMPAPPVPVKIGYFTTFPDDLGQPVRYPDIYGRAAAAQPASPEAAGPSGSAPATCSAPG